jgi:hypothetical protein
VRPWAEPSAQDHRYLRGQDELAVQFSELPARCSSATTRTARSSHRSAAVQLIQASTSLDQRGGLRKQVDRRGARARESGGPSTTLQGESSARGRAWTGPTEQVGAVRVADHPASETAGRSSSPTGAATGAAGGCCRSSSTLEGGQPRALTCTPAHLGVRRRVRAHRAAVSLHTRLSPTTPYGSKPAWQERRDRQALRSGSEA